MKWFKKKLKELRSRFRQWKFKDWWTERAILKVRIQEDILLKRDARERAMIAEVFNDRYCIAERYDKTTEELVPGHPGIFGIPVKQGNRWMCPTCNQIHAPVSHDSLVGLRYPACCEHRAEYKYDKLNKLGTLKRPLGFCGPGGLYRKMLKLGIERRDTVIGS